LSALTEGLFIGPFIMEYCGMAIFTQITSC